MRRGKTLANRLTTDLVPEHQRLDYWQMVCSELIGSFALKDYDTSGFHANFDVAEVGDLKIGTFEAANQTLERSRSLIKPSDSDDYIVVLGLSDHTINVEQGVRHRSGPGGIFLIDITQPYSTGYPEHLKVVDVFIPRKKMEEVLGPARLAAGLCIETSQNSYPVLAGFLRSLAEHGDSFDPAIASRMSTIAIDLIAAGFAEKMGEEPARHFGGAATLYRAKAYIDANLGRSNMGMQEIAAAMKVSVRRLHQISLEEGISLVDWMWERRLARAWHILVDPASASMTVGSIAYRCGFADHGHFSRRFKDRFGQTPVECRVSHTSGARR